MLLVSQGGNMAFGRIKRIITNVGTNYMFCGLNSRNCKIKRSLLRWRGFEVGDDTRIVGPLYIDGLISIGKNVFIGKNMRVHGNGHVFVEDNCDIAPEVTFLTGTHEVGLAERRAGTGKTLDIKVGAGTWIGAKTTILPGVVIGKGCVIAAGSLVNRNVLDNTMVAGVPAKVIKNLEPLAEGENNETFTNQFCV